MDYDKELSMIAAAVKDGYQKYSASDISMVSDKARFDIVTDVDCNIEKFIIERIRETFPNDRILSEETNSETAVEGRTWTIDPIDGTYNMANAIRIFGVQCAMYNGGIPVVSVIYLPHFNELYTAVKGCGAYLNGSRIFVKKPDLEHCIVTFGDFSHTSAENFEHEYRTLYHVAGKVAKIRMLGASSVDFALIASGKTNAVVEYTKNKWDIAPGMLLCSEAGAIIKSYEGEYMPDSSAIIAASTEELFNCFIQAINQ